MGEKSTRSESEISLLLNTYMYLNYYEAEEGQRLKDILTDLLMLPDYGPGGVHYGEYEILRQAVKADAKLGELQISAQSTQLGFDSGTRACLFWEEGTGTFYVVYRGTGDGEWMDNGLGMTQSSTLQQRRALSYFEQAAEYSGMTKEHRVIVTGHSKGGNKAQYVTMATDRSNLIDRCYSVDGQGFSEKAIEEWNRKYGQSGYLERVNKLYGINGENDYVSVLGHTIIPEANIRYIQTPVKGSDFVGFHDIKYMFSKIGENDEIEFTGQINSYVNRQKEWGLFARKLSSGIMELEPDQRAGCAAFIMQIMELGGKQKTGLNGERLTWSDWKHFKSAGLPAIAAALLGEYEGKRLWQHLFRKGDEKEVLYAVNPMLLVGEAEELEQISVKVMEIAMETELVIEQLKTSLKYGFPYSFGICGKIEKEQENICKESDKIRNMSEVLYEVARIYIGCEQKVACI